MKDNAPRRQFVGGLFGVGAAVPALAAQSGAAAPKGIVNVRDRGATGDGKRFDTKAIQDAMDACSGSGGGTVYVPPGTYLTGTLVLKRRVNLHLETGAVLLGSKDLNDYRTIVSKLRSYVDNYTEKSLLYGEDLVEDVATTGRGSVIGSAIAPVVKVCGNPQTYARMSGDQDINAGRIVTGEAGVAEVGREIFDRVLDVAAGASSKAEALGHREYFIPYKFQDLCVNA